MRKIIYKIKLDYDLPEPHAAFIYLATYDIAKIPELIANNRIWYDKPAPFVKWSIAGKAMPFNWPQEKYDEEIANVDINDGVEVEDVEAGPPLIGDIQ